MSKTKLQKSHKGLSLIFILFFTSIIFGFLGFDKVSKILLYAIFPIFFWTYYHVAIYVMKFNTKAYKRIKHKQPVFNHSLSDDEDDPPYTKPNNINKNNDGGDIGN